MLFPVTTKHFSAWTLSISAAYTLHFYPFHCMHQRTCTIPFLANQFFFNIFISSLKFFSSLTLYIFTIHLACACNLIVAMNFPCFNFEAFVTFISSHVFTDLIVRLFFCHRLVSDSHIHIKSFIQIFLDLYWNLSKSALVFRIS